MPRWWSAGAFTGWLDEVQVRIAAVDPSCRHPIEAQHGGASQSRHIGTAERADRWNTLGSPKNESSRGVSLVGRRQGGIELRQAPGAESLVDPGAGCRLLFPGRSLPCLAMPAPLP
jgi:hypothetical protein